MEPQANDSDPISTESDSPPLKEPVWTYRGYQLRPGDFTTAMVHLFRAEISRANIWRQRLDATTNWAVVATGAVISFSFGTNVPYSHSVILLNMLLITLFLFIEARRYRYYELWSYRVRLMETDFFAAMLVPPFGPAPDWAESLAETLLHPHYPISLWEALGRRLRRNYLWIYLLLGVVWSVKIWLHPSMADTWGAVVERASVGAIPGQVVIAVGVVFNVLLVMVALLTQNLKQATGEVLPRYGDGLDISSLLHANEPGEGSTWAWFRRSGKRRQMLTFIITDHADAVGQKVTHEMHRGLTRLDGVGMFTGQRHAVLLCALTITEVPHLKALVSEVDPRGFIIVAPAQEVLGQGFVPLGVK